MSAYKIKDSNNNIYELPLASIAIDEYKYTSFSAWNPISTDILSWSYSNVALTENDKIITAYNRGLRFTEVIPFEKWRDEVFTFVNDERFTIKASSHRTNTYNYSNSVYNNLGDSVILSYTCETVVLSIYYNDTTQIVQFGTTIKITYNDTNQVPIVDGNIVSGTQSILNYDCAIAYDSVNKVFVENLDTSSYYLQYASRNPQNAPLQYICYTRNTDLPPTGYLRVKSIPYNITVSPTSTEYIFGYNALNKSITYSSSSTFDIAQNTKVILKPSIFIPYGDVRVSIHNRTQTYTNQYILYYLLFDKDDTRPPYQPDKPDNPDEPENPDDNPNKPNPGPVPGGDGDQDNDDDKIPIPEPTPLPIDGLGISIYDLPIDNLPDLKAFLWSTDFTTNIHKLFQSPNEALISFKFIPLAITRRQLVYIYLGNMNTGVKGYKIASTSVQIDFGTLTIKPYYNDYSDFMASHVSIYLPYIGYRTLDANFAMNATLHLVYNIDVISGACVAIIKATKTTKINSFNSIIQQYVGDCSFNVPLSSVDYSGLVTGLAGLAMGNVNPSNFINSRHMENLTNLSANSGYLSSQRPYIEVSRDYHYIDSNYGKLIGYDAKMSYTIGQLRGFTKVTDMRITSSVATEMELNEIKRLFKDGVIV